MLHRLLYSSVSVVPLDEQELETLLGLSRERNEAVGVTGLLVHVRAPEAGQAAFVQVLEGDRDAVQEIYARISRDDLHNDLRVLDQGPIATRAFAGWTMRLEEVPLAGLLAPREATGPVTPPEATSLRDVVHDVGAMNALVAQYV